MEGQKHVWDQNRQVQNGKHDVLSPFHSAIRAFMIFHRVSKPYNFLRK